MFVVDLGTTVARQPGTSAACGANHKRLFFCISAKSFTLNYPYLPALMTSIQIVQHGFSSIITCF